MDPVATAGITNSLLGMGLPGLIILALGWLVVRQQNKIDDLQEKRIAESRELLTAMNNTTSALGSLTEVIKQMKGGTQ